MDIDLICFTCTVYQYSALCCHLIFLIFYTYPVELHILNQQVLRKSMARGNLVASFRLLTLLGLHEWFFFQYIWQLFQLLPPQITFQLISVNLVTVLGELVLACVTLFDCTLPKFVYQRTDSRGKFPSIQVENFYHLLLTHIKVFTTLTKFRCLLHTYSY